jgi:KDO2-lipid IV(A) lauroyltransferase
MRNWLEYIPLLIVAKLIRLLPRSTAHALGRALGALGRLLQPKRVAIATDNLRRALPEVEASERDAMVRRVFRDLGVGFVEMMRLDMFNGSQDLERYFDIEGLEHIHEALALGKGCILLTGHIGFWEAGGYVFPVQGIPTGIVAKPIKNPLVDSFFHRLRQSYGGYVIDSRKGARRILKALQKNHMVGILMDQHASRSQAVKVPFFGRTAYTTPIIAQIAMKYQVPVVPAFCYRSEGDRYRIVIEPMRLLDREFSDDKVVEKTALLTRIIEHGVRRDPAQWFWVHRRWKEFPRHARRV